MSKVGLRLEELIADLTFAADQLDAFDAGERVASSRLRLTRFTDALREHVREAKALREWAEGLGLTRESSLTDAGREHYLGERDPVLEQEQREDRAAALEDRS